jgi:uncharacterized protein
MDRHEKSVQAALSSDTGGFRGYAARFLNIDRQGDIILPGAFAKALPQFMDDGGMVLADHANKTGSVIGTLIDAAEDATGLMVDVQFSATKSGQEVRQLIAEKAVRKMSISFYAKGTRYSEKQVFELWKTYGHKPDSSSMKRVKSGVNVISEVAEILEVSVVPIPANPGAEILAVKSFETPEKLDLSEVFRRAELVERIRRKAVTKGKSCL